VPSISIIPRNQIKDSINSSQTINSPISSSSQSIKPAIKTYEQRELEYRLARLRIMGEEESSTKDEDDNPTIESNIITFDESTTTPISTKISNNTIGCSQSSLQTHSTLDNYYTLNNTGIIQFTPNTNSTGSFPQHQYHNAYSVPYSQIPSLRYPNATLYMSSTVPSSNPWYQQQQTPYGTQQYSHPQ